MTEVGAVLVGGGELHDRWSSLCRTSAPLRRGIQRFTGITQAMVDGGAVAGGGAAAAGASCWQGRVLVAHNAPFDRRVLRQAFERIGLEWPDPPVICTAALARTHAAAAAPARPRRARGRAGDRGASIAHRALADAETCARRPVRAVPAAVRQRGHGRRRAGAARARRRPRTRPQRRGGRSLAPAPRRTRRDCRAAPATRRRSPDFGELPSRPGRLPVPRRGAAGALRRQVGVDPQPGPRPLRPVLAAGGVDRARHRRRLPHDRLRAGRADPREPADQGAQAAGQQAADPAR